MLKLDIRVRNKDLHPPVAGIWAERATWQWCVCALQTMIRAQRSTCCFFREHDILFQSQTQHITTHTHTHGYGSVRQFIWESTVPSAAWKHERRRDAHNNMHVRSRCLLSLCGQPAAVLLCSVWSLSLETTCTARRRRCSARKNVSLGVFTRAKQLFMNELKLKMAVDARRKWLPREKVMPGKPGGDDGDAHTRGPIREQCARPSPASLVVRNSPATHGRQRSMARDCGLLACRTGIKDCAQISFHPFKLLSVEANINTAEYLFGNCLQDKYNLTRV